MTTAIKRPCVLIVEDYRLARAMYRVTLEHAGFEVLEAADGVEALLRVRDSVPNLILMDSSMPLMDGWEVTRHLKSDGRTAGIPIVVLSARARRPCGENHASRLRGASDQAVPALRSRQGSAPVPASLT